MSKNKPKTIADLEINWTFKSKGLGFKKEVSTFDQLNPTLTDVRVKSGSYVFNIKNETFFITEWESCRLSSFIWSLQYYLRTNFPEFLPFELSSFELIQEDEFRIHVK